MVKRCHLGDLARFDRSDPPQTSAKYTPKRICKKVMTFWKFQKNKKVRKSHFRVLAYVYEGFGCSERSKPQSGAWSTSEHLGAPKSPKSHFFIRVRRLRVVWEPQMHFWRFWALVGLMYLFCAPLGAEGARPLTDPTPYRSLTEGEGGGFPLLSLSDSPSKSKYSTTANLVPRYCCGAKSVKLRARTVTI